MLARYYRDRHDGGRALAHSLREYGWRPDSCVVALPRGGVPVAFEVATRLGLPLDVFTVRKLGVPGQEELAMGAIASGGIVIINPALVEMLGITDEAVDRVIARERVELERREAAYREAVPKQDFTEKTVIVVDDGLATGATMRAAAAALRRAHAARIVVAVPAGDPETCDELRSIADEVICAVTPDPFFSVGAWYEDFAQTSDLEVKELLELACRRREIENRAVGNP